MSLDFLHGSELAGVREQPVVTSNWGHFEGEVACRRDDGGAGITLLEPLTYVDPRCLRWRVEGGTRIEAVGLPHGFWPVIGGPFEGLFLNASVIHSAACAGRARPWRAIHRMFYEACRCSGVDALKAKAMYYAVFHFGPRWHVEERSSLESGVRDVEVIVRDLTPSPPTEADVAAIVAYFSCHDVPAEDIPKLDILDGGD